MTDTVNAEDAEANDDRQELLEELIDSNREVVDRLDREEYWRTQNRRSNTRWKVAAAGAVAVSVVVLVVLGVLLGKVLDTLDAVRLTQQTGTPTGRVLLCAASPDVLAATTRDEQRARLDACFERNGVDVYALIDPPAPTLPDNR